MRRLKPVRPSRFERKEKNMTAHVASAPPQSRIEVLKQKHAILKSRIEQEQRYPSAADFYLRQLKKQKLLLKEKIEKIRTGSAH